MNECKCCASELLPEINQWCFDGKAYKDVAKELQARGLKISESSVKRHALSHIPGYKPRSELGKIDAPKPVQKRSEGQEGSDFRIDVEGFLQAIGCTSDSPLEEVYSRGLSKLLANQIAILYCKQQHQIENNFVTPMEDYRVLQLLLGAVGAVVDFQLKPGMAAKHGLDLINAVAPPEPEKRWTIEDM